MSEIRVRRTPAQWRAIFTEYAASGLSQQAFCESVSIPLSTFCRWRQRLAGEALLRVADGADLDFVELPRSATTPTDAAPLDTGLALRLELGAGIVLELRRTA